MSRQVLTGHTDPASAYVVDDYPYGFRLRTQIRYWIETKPKHGQRFMSQTMNPKTGRWNKPKASTYATLIVMFLDDQGHVQQDGIGLHASTERLDTFLANYDVEDDSRTREVIRHIRAARRADKLVTWSIHECGPDCQERPHQTIQEQGRMLQNLTRHELQKETIAAIKGEEYP